MRPLLAYGFLLAAAGFAAWAYTLWDPSDPVFAATTPIASIGAALCALGAARYAATRDARLIAAGAATTLAAQLVAFVLVLKFPDLLLHALFVLFLGGLSLVAQGAVRLAIDPSPRHGEHLDALRFGTFLVLLDIVAFTTYELMTGLYVFLPGDALMILGYGIATAGAGELTRE